MNKTRVLHLTWSADKAGMVTELVRVQSQDLDLVLDVCFGTRGNGAFAVQIEQLGIYPSFLGMRSRYSLLENLKGGILLWKIIKKGAYDIIHMQEAMIPFPFLAAAYASPLAKLVLHNRGEFNFTETALQHFFQKIKKIAYRLLVGCNVDRLICNSQFTVRETPISPKHNSKVEVLYNAIDIVEIQRILLAKQELRNKLRNELGLPQNAFLVTVVARLVEFKRIDRFIEAVSKATRLAPEFTALIVGTGPLDSHLEKTIFDIGLNERIRLLGHRFDAKDIIAASDLFVLPSSGEAFGIAALEAVALEIPIIVFEDAGGPLEFVSHGVNGYIEPDVNSLVERLVEFGRGMASISPVNAQSKSCSDIHYYAQRIREIYDDLLDKSLSKSRTEITR